MSPEKETTETTETKEPTAEETRQHWAEKVPFRTARGNVIETSREDILAMAQLYEQSVFDQTGEKEKEKEPETEPDANKELKDMRAELDGMKAEKQKERDTAQIMQQLKTETDKFKILKDYDYEREVHFKAMSRQIHGDQTPIDKMVQEETARFEKLVKDIDKRIKDGVDKNALAKARIQQIATGSGGTASIESGEPKTYEDVKSGRSLDVMKELLKAQRELQE